MRLLHILIIVILLTEIAYSSFQVFVVLDIAGGAGPLWFRADALVHGGTDAVDVLIARRLYAIEGWIAFVGLVLYIAVTEIVPRKIGL